MTELGRKTPMEATGRNTHAPEDTPKCAFTSTDTTRQFRMSHEVQGTGTLGGSHHGRLGPQPLHLLAGDSRDEFKILIHVQHREPGQFGGCGDEDVRQ